MKVLFVCGGGLVSGLEKVSLSVMRGLQANGFQVVALMSSWGAPEFAQRLESSGIRYVRLSIGFISKTLTWRNLWMTFDQLVRVPGLWWGYWRLLSQERLDVVIHTNFHHVTVLFPFLRPAREVFYVHNCFPESAFYRRWFQLFSPRFGRVVCVSQATADCLVNLGVPPAKLHVIHNGVALPSLALVRRRGPDQALRVGIIGQVAPWKGHTVLLQALRLLRERGLSVHCLVFGEGSPEYRRKLEEQVSDWRLEGLIEWRGFVQDVGAAYQELDVCVVPSIFPDPFPLTAVEALGFGLPVIASRIGGLPEIVSDGVTGYLVEPGDASQLADRLAQFASEETLTRRMGAAARVYAEQHLAEPIMVNAFVKLLQNPATSAVEV